MTTPLHCPICNVNSTLKCGGCRNVVYCGKEHQKEHWRKGHKAQCKCFEIVTDQTLGRHLVATRDIKKAEIILREFPVLVGPKTLSVPMCLGCHKILALQSGQKDFYKCSKCTWPLCGPQCEALRYHKSECKLMADKKFVCPIKYTAEQKREPAYCAIAPLRLMLLKSEKPDIFSKISILEDHLNERMNTAVYNVLKANLVTFVHTVLNIADFDEREILRMAAILDTNAFEVRQDASKIRALYLTAAMLSHDCIPNTRHLFDDKMEILIIATVGIPKGAVISTTYTQSLKSSLMRREHLKQSKCFECCCNRCKDPTELNTFVGAICCSKCKIGKVISTNPLDNSAVWKCQLCPHEIPAKQISWGNSALQKEIESLDRTNPAAFEEFLIRYRDTLHEKNTHVLQIKYALTQLYGNVKGFLLSELSDAAVKRKVDLCLEMLEIADLFEPGWGHFRGALLLDLQEVLAVQTKREYNAQLITKEATQEKLIESMQLLQEAVQILSLEPGMKDVLQERVAALAKEIEME